MTTHATALRAQGRHALVALRPLRGRRIVSGLAGASVAALVLGAAVQAIAAPATVSITSQPAAFSPDGDGQEDAFGIGIDLSDPANVTVRVLSGSNTVVRQLVTAQSMNSGRQAVSWDGRTDAGEVTGQGTYTVEVTATDASNVPSHATVLTAIDNRKPGALTQPKAGATISGSVALALQATNGFALQDVRFDLGGCSFPAAVDTQSVGLWRASADVAPCRAGAQDFAANVSWTDSLGAGHNRRLSSSVTVDDVTPPTLAAADQSTGVATLASQGNLTPASVLLRCSDNGTVDSISARINGSDGLTVRRLSIDPGYCRDNWNQAALNWDALDGDGKQVADGTYTADMTTTDSAGLTSSATVTLIVDTRVPAVITSPTPGDVPDGMTDLTLAAAPGVALDSVDWSIPGCGIPSVTSPTGAAWTTKQDLSCASSATAWSAFVTWEPLAGVTARYATSVNVTKADHTSPVLTPYNSNDDATVTMAGPQDDQLQLPSLTFGCQDNVAVDHLTGTVTSAAGVVVKHIDPNGLSCGWYGSVSTTWDGLDDDGSRLPDGTYSLVVTAFDAAGNHTSARVSLHIDTRLPGRFTAPAEGAKVAGSTRFAFAPAAGVVLDEVDFNIGNCSWLTGTDDGSGAFAATIDIDPCIRGNLNATVYAYWTDSYGQRHLYQARRSLTLDDVAGPSLSFQDQAGFTVTAASAGQTSPAYLAINCSDPSGVTSMEATVTDGTGQVVHHETLGGNYCASIYTPFVTFTGHDDAGIRLPDGDYQLTVDAGDGAGNKSTLRHVLHIDSTVPGALTSPVAGDTLAGTAGFAFAPAKGVPLTRVDLYLAGRSFSIFNSSPDGIWRTTFPVGMLEKGDASVRWTAWWRDSSGADHSYTSDQFTVGVDPQKIPLDVGFTEDHGKAPWSPTVTVNTSDPNSRPLTITVDWGDGTPATSSTSSGAYPAQQFSHAYTKPGSYDVLVSVTNGAGGFTSARHTVQVTGTSGSAPTLALGLSSTTGAAPLRTVATLQATDTDDDPLNYKVDFGDGSDPVNGTWAAGTAPEHTYQRAGGYLIRAEVSDGQQTAVRIARVTAVLPTPLAAVAGDDRVVIAGDATPFDASASRPGGMIDDYSWNFGDGQSGAGPTPTHVFDKPGDYTVRLTVRSGSAGSSATVHVTVKPVPATPGLAITVTGGGSPLAGAQVMVIQSDGSRVSAITTTGGAAILQGLPDGSVSAYVWADGYQPSTVTAMIADGSGKASIDLIGGEVGAITLSAQRLTLDQIKAKGIDLADPENTHVYEAKINLFFDYNDETKKQEYDVIVTPSGVRCEIGDCQTGGGSGGGGSSSQTCRPDAASGPCFVIGDYKALPEVQYVAGEPIIHWLVLPVRASWLKEFFDVKEVVQNLAPGFSFTDGQAQLALPSGLSLAPLPTPQKLTVAVPNIPGGQSSTVTWTVRGDTEGSYDLSAAYSGMLQPVGVPVHLTSKTQDSLKVWGGSALKMVVTVDDSTYRWAPYNVTVELQSKIPAGEDVPIYNAAIEMLPRPTDAPAEQAYWALAPGIDALKQQAVIDPDHPLTADYVVMAGLGRQDLRLKQLFLHPDKSFIARTGGDTDIETELRTKAATDSNPFLRVLAKVEGDMGSEHIAVSWPNPQKSSHGVPASYELYTSESMRSPDWQPLRTIQAQAGNATQINLDRNYRQLGRYYAVVTTFTDGKKVYAHGLGIGPPRYVALGDSFSSGEGVPEFEPGTASDVTPLTDDQKQYGDLTDDNKCHRSVGSYSRLLAADAGLTKLEPAEFHACSGAIADDVDVKNPKNNGELAQRDHVNDFTDVITLSMGGNDIGFSDIAKYCLALDCAHLIHSLATAGSDEWLDDAGRIWNDSSIEETCKSPTTEDERFLCAAKIDGLLASGDAEGDRTVSASNLINGVLKARLVRVYTELANRAPGATIYVQPYPNVLVGDSDPGVCRVMNLANFGLTQQERMALSSLIGRLNSVVDDAMRTARGLVSNPARLVLVPLTVNGTDVFAGHALCNGSSPNVNASAFNPVVTPIGIGVPGQFNYSIHPNATGQRLYYKALKDAYIQRTDFPEVKPLATLIGSTLTVPTGATQVSTANSWFGSTVSATLIGPNGTRYSADSPGVHSWSTATTQQLTVDDPTPGVWKVELYGQDLPHGAEITQVHMWGTPPTNAPPTARVSAAAVDGTPGSYTFDARASKDSDGSIANYDWYFADGSTANGATASHTFTGDGPRGATLRATDNAGAPSWTSITLPGPVKVPGVVTGVTTVAGDGQARVSWTAPKDDGGSPVSGYVVTGSEGTVQAVDAGQTQAVFDKLSNGTAYTFSVAAKNTAGTATAVTSQPVTPVVGASLPVDPGTGGPGASPSSSTSASPSPGAPVTTATSPPIQPSASVGQGQASPSASPSSSISGSPGGSGSPGASPSPTSPSPASPSPSAVITTSPSEVASPSASPGVSTAPSPSASTDPTGSLPAGSGGAPSSTEPTHPPGGSAGPSQSAGGSKTDRAPVANPDILRVPAAHITTVNVLANDTDPDEDPLRVTAHGKAGHGTVVCETAGVCSYTPNGNFVGADGFSYTVDDGGGLTSQGQVTVTVSTTSVLAVGDTLGVTRGQPGQVNVLANDFASATRDLRVLNHTTARHGSVTCKPSGRCRYQPAPGWTGSDRFDYLATDSHGNSSRATVRITVIDPPQDAAPRAFTDQARTVGGSAVTVNVLANDTDADGDPLIVTGHDEPAHGTVACTSDRCTYLPRAGFAGTDSFRYVVGDGHGGSATGEVTIVVRPAPPVARPDALTVTGTVAGNVNVLHNDESADGARLSVWSGPPQAGHGNVRCVRSGRCRYVARPGYVGGDAFTYTVTDARGGIAHGLVIVTVAGPRTRSAWLTVQAPVVVNAGKRSTISGTLGSGNKGIRGERVELWARTGSADFATAATTKTGWHGGYSFDIAPRTNTTYVVIHSSTSGLGGALSPTADVHI